MLLDVVVMVLLALALYKGFTKGLIVAGASFLAYLVGLAAALKLSAVVAAAISESSGGTSRWLPVLAFVFLFIAVVLGVRLLARAVEGLVNIAMMGWANKLGGFFLYALLYGTVVSVVVFYATQLGFENAFAQSVTYPFLIQLAPALMAGLAWVFPFLENIFGSLTQFFGRFSHGAA